MNWQQMSQKCFPGKTPNACRKRHERLREQQNLEQWDGVRFEELARAYMEVREQIWTILGDRIGEKWTVVEAKVSKSSLFMSLCDVQADELPSALRRGSRISRAPHDPEANAAIVQVVAMTAGLVLTIMLISP